MPIKYPNLLSPIKIRNTVFRNRFIVSRSSPAKVKGHESYPTDPMITDYAHKAKNGAALVTCGTVGMPHIIMGKDLAEFERTGLVPGLFNINDYTCQNALSRLTEEIHFYGGKASIQIGGYVPLKYDVSTGISSVDIGLGITRKGEEIPAGLLDGIADDFARQASLMKRFGFDAVYLHMSYRLTILGRFLSPLTNKRTDRYGGSLENQARFPIMVADRIKKACGTDFIIEASISGVEQEGGRTIEDTVKQAGLFAGHIDILQVRTSSIDPAHPTGFNSVRNPFLSLAETVKKSGAEIAVATVGGFLDMDICEDVIASGKADFIAAARTWISNPDFGTLAYEGRGEDVVPCIKCNQCLGKGPDEPLTSTCSVNPVWGFEHKIDSMIKPPASRKNVAIVGGGPGGMKAALVAAGRGHSVTLYEKSKVLGGPLKITENVSFKWPQRDYINFMIRQVHKAGINVLLDTEATPDLLRNKGYDTIIAAVGAEPVCPLIPGVDGKNVIFASDVYGNEDTLDRNVVIIGGGEIGIETGMHLAQKGHQVTLLEMTGKLAPSAPPLHFYSLFKEAWERELNLKCIVNARCESIAEGKVAYIDASGTGHELEAGSVVIAAGMKPRNDLAIKFFSCAERVYMIGDCVAAGNVQKAVRSAFSAASMI
jgi:2,4-dienoyl-CoA reductase-like NADH-dependent reductase (Old Yellow Enzyme family)/thioredoxin reductase